MTPDIKLKDYYLKFIDGANEDVEEYKTTILELKELKKSIKEKIDSLLNFYKEEYNIDLNKYDIEYIQSKFNPSKTLYNKVKLLYNDEENNLKRNNLLVLIKYCNVLQNIKENVNLCNLAINRRNIDSTYHKKLITLYYKKVQQLVLEGHAYKFPYGMGMFCINRWKMGNTKNPKRMLDYKATKINKERAIKENKKLYDVREAEWYADRNIPYDGYDYRVYRDDSYYYDINIINPSICNIRVMQFKRLEYINSKFRNKTYEEIAKTCNTIEEIYELPVDIKVKLNILLINHPTKYLNFIRNSSGSNFDVGAKVIYNTN